MDYRKFLGKVESAVLPYFGGACVDAPSRRLRVSTPPAPGWWRFDVQGRTATAREPAGPEGLDGLPLIRGHLWGSRLVREGAVAEPVLLLPEEEPPRFSPVRTRRWHDGTLVFETLEFEGEAEGTARLMLEEERTLAEVKAVPASLRAAFGYAVLEGTSRALGIRFSPAEVRGQVLSVSEGGRPAAEARLRALAAEREAHVRAVETRLLALEAQRRRAEEEVRLQAELARMRSRPRPLEWQAQGLTRVERALESAGARLLDTRRLGSDRLEVTFGFMGERFISIVEAGSLQVVDAGICLAGSDRTVTLESLPSVIREAIEDDVLVITRHA
ncbi:hypothetical protein [Vitiosangium sp. GDMCC 1.1324]|uniref:hypothetical protein n=1 Tax=Vitiosangium sp. (strain GDMCC 1.1324) TaxID=2138576 RepID=UPI000D376D74|nr:hypothetical protein [Vitiosangium sp. GDMCC 1.1324]PTL79420.1 hypothetical protein DAT35_35100 [Vitiosangium sp. GDMCC 1.1324]